MNTVSFCVGDVVDTDEIYRWSDTTEATRGATRPVIYPMLTVFTVRDWDEEVMPGSISYCAYAPVETATRPFFGCVTHDGEESVGRKETELDRIAKTGVVPSSLSFTVNCFHAWILPAVKVTGERYVEVEKAENCV